MIKMKHQYLKNVVTLKYNPERCIGCQICVQVCPHAVFRMKNGKAQIVDKESCMECGACANNCLFSAIEVKSGVGCAAAIIMGKLTGTEPNCGCSGSNNGGCC
jgi:NAD-dependent dihydropyrimidine dehydrogenase PreA subunit